jgi:hypothetical protein
VRPEFATAVESVALQMIVTKRVLGYLLTNGFTDSRGRLRGEVSGLEKANGRLLAGLRELGATPASFAKLGLDTAQTFDLARHWADEDERARREAAGEVVDVEVHDGG